VALVTPGDEYVTLISHW